MPDAAPASNPAALLVEAELASSGLSARLPAPPASRGRFQPGHVKTGGRTKGVLNKNRRLSIDHILQLVDPLEGLARIARGEPMLLAPSPDAEPVLTYPTIADVRAALTTLANKVIPDLKSVSVEQHGNQVEVHLSLGQMVTIAAEAPPR
jgi:hypothetical protein